MAQSFPTHALTRRARRNGGQRRLGSRKTDVVLLCLLVLLFPSFCPVPLGNDHFFKVHLRSDDPWAVGPWMEHANLGGACVTSRGFALGPLSLVRQEW